MKTYPLVADYKIAVTIADSFATLNTLEPCYVGKDLFFATGGPAVVFKMKDTNTRQYSAVKCFIKEFSERSHHFSHISKFLASLPSNPYFVNYTYYDKEIWVNDDEYPILQMPWIEGKTLSQAIPELCRKGNTAAIQELANKFDKMALWLLEQDMAHGDLKPDNIIVTSDNELMLVDYDGMFVPSLAGRKSPELGTAEYRHPKRTGANFNRHLDDFPILVLSLSLHSLAHSPELYVQAGSGDALLFTSADYKNLLTCSQMKFFQSNAENTMLFSRFSMLMNAVMLPVLELVGLRELLRETAAFVVNKNTVIDFSDYHEPWILSKQSHDTHYEGDDFVESQSDKWFDAFGVMYSSDKKLLIKSPKNISNYTIETGTKIICKNAFLNCSSLENIKLPQSLEYIEEKAFVGCDNLTTVDIPKDIININDTAFNSGVALFDVARTVALLTIEAGFISTVHTESDNEFEDEYGVLYSANKQKLLKAPKNIVNYIIPDGVKVICNKAFQNCRQLISISMPSTLALIGKDAFNCCTFLESIVFPSHLIAMHDSAFYGCESLTSIVLPETLTELRMFAFSKCSDLRTVVFPKKLKKIAAYAFHSCTSLDSLTLPNSLTSIGVGAFYNCPISESVLQSLQSSYGNNIVDDITF